MFNLRPHADRKRSNRSGLLFATFLASTALTATAGYAQTATWIDNSALTWDTPSGWDTNAEPDANTDVIIPPADQTNGGTNVRVSTTDAVARSIQINGGLSVYNGGVLVVGEDLTATGPSALMGINGDDGAGGFSTLTVNGQFNFDVGGGFSVYDGGILTTHGAVLSGNGVPNNANNFAATVNNGGLFDNSGYEMTLGRAGHAYLYLYNNGTLLTDMLYLGREAATATSLGGDGLLLIGSNSTATVTNTIEVGGAGRGEVRITAGGQLDSVVARVGDQAGGIGLVTVNAGGWHNVGALNVGLGGEGSVSVINGGAADTDTMTLGTDAGGIGTVLVSDAGSALDVLSSAYVGFHGAGSLTVQNGATANFGTNAGNDLLVGYYEDSEGSALVESGGALAGTGTLRIGSEGAGVVIVDGTGSLASFNELTAGGSAGGNGQIVLGNGAEMAITQFATIGYAGTASLSLTGGSLFTAADMGIATADIASTGDVLVNDSRIEVAGQFDLGTYGTATMRLENRGELRTGSFYAANAAGSAADFVLTGFSTSWENTGDAHIGMGDGARLSLLDQASAYVGGNLFIGNAAGTGESGVAIANGFISVQGDLTQYANSTYTYVIGDGAMAGGGIAVNGTATIEQGARLGFAIDGNVAMGDQFIVLNAIGGVNGTYVLNGGQVSAFLTVDALYDPTSVTLVVTGVREFADVAWTPNQIATAGGLQSLGSGNALYDTILNITTEDEARFAFDQLSGEVHASLKTALIEDSRFVRNAANDRIRVAFGDATVTATPVLAYGPGGPERAAPDTDLLTVWGQGFGSWGDWDSDGNAASVSRNTGGFLTGADAFVSDWRLGLMAGYSHTSLSADDRASSGSVDSYHLGLYGGTQWGNLAFRSGLAYAWHDIDTARNVTFPGFAERLSGSYDAGTLHGFGELAYQFDVTPRTVLEPFANLAFVSHRTDAYAETGGAAALSAAGQTTETTFTTLGLRASHGFTLNAVEVTARGMLGWRHAFGDMTPTTTHAFAGGDAFTVAGVPIGKNAALIEAGLDFKLTPAATLGFTYAGQFASGSTDQAVKANLNVRF